MNANFQTMLYILANGAGHCERQSCCSTDPCGSAKASDENAFISHGLVREKSGPGSTEVEVAPSQTCLKWLACQAEVFPYSRASQNCAHQVMMSILAYCLPAIVRGTGHLSGRQQASLAIKEHSRLGTKTLLPMCDGC